MNEPRYWLLLIGSILFAALLIRWFDSKKTSDKYGALRAVGYVLLLGNLSLPMFSIFNPEQQLSWHRSLPVHFCGINYLLIAINCFVRNRYIYTFTAFLGTVGGLHGILTPQLTVGDAPLVLVDYYMRHTSIIILPIIMTRSFGFRFPRRSWLWIYVVAAVLSTSVGGLNWILNTCFPSDVTANYMYMWEAPKVDNPFVQNWSWPWYIIPLHVGLMIHLVAINAMFRWLAPIEFPDITRPWKRFFT